MAGSYKKLTVLSASVDRSLESTIEIFAEVSITGGR